MKLFEKYNRLNLSVTILVFAAGSTAFYFLINYVFIHQIDKSLQTEQQEVLAYVKEHNALPEIITTKSQYTTYEPVHAARRTEFLTVSNRYEKNEEDLREIQFTIAVSGSYYLVIVDKEIEETEALLKVIISFTIAMIGFILLTGYLINRTVIRKLWRPFYQTIGQLKTYNLTDSEPLTLSQPDIDEFSLLNQSIAELIDRIQHDYKSLKNFTGQAAHEMQTPLAIIRTKLNMLMQNEALLEKGAQNITDIEFAANRLGRLHQSLLLLTKVENKQFLLNEQVQLDEIVTVRWNEYIEMGVASRINVSLDIQPATILFHKHLAEIMVGNLLNNAIRYNKPNGDIKIVLQQNLLSISNTSVYPALDNNSLFKRFYRNQYSEDGNGLGLSIVKEICDLAGFIIAYAYADDRHIFTINFSHPH